MADQLPGTGDPWQPKRAIAPAGPYRAAGGIELF